MTYSIRMTETVTYEVDVEADELGKILGLHPDEVAAALNPEGDEWSSDLGNNFGHEGLLDWIVEQRGANASITVTDRDWEIEADEIDDLQAAEASIYDESHGSGSTVVLLVEHRQSADGPEVIGPFDNADAARRYALEKFISGAWDADGADATIKSPRTA